MTRGRVGADGDPRFGVTIHGSRAWTIDAIVDTGFTGYLCLSRRHRRRMRLAYVGRERVELADGRVVRERVYRGEVTFDGRRRRVLVALTRSHDTLIGTALLRGKRLVIDFRRGSVAVRDA